MPTTRMPLTPAWSLLGTAPLFVEALSVSIVVISCGPSAPAGGSMDGIFLSSGLLLSGTFGAPGEQIYGRAAELSATVAVSSAAVGASASESHIGEVGGNSATTTASVVRPADAAAYAVGDLIANNTTAGSVMPLTLAIARVVNKPVVLRGARIKANITALKAGIVRLHLFKDAPTVSVGDNGVLNSAETYAFTESNYLGSVDVTLAKQTSDGFVKGSARIADGSLAEVIEPSAGTVNIFGLLEARTAFTPSSGATFTVTLEALRD